MTGDATMDRLNLFLILNWFSLLSVAAALSLGVVALLRWRQSAWSLPCALGAAFLGLCGLSGLVLPFDWAVWVASLGGAGLFLMLLGLITTAWWNTPLASALGAATLLGVGGLLMIPAGKAVAATGQVIISLEPVQPWWLLLLGLIPVIIWLSYRSLAGLGPVRRWVAIGLRCLLVILLTLALAEVRLRHQNEHLTVLYLVDRSLSVPEDIDLDAEADGTQGRIDRRWERVRRFINESVEQAKRHTEHRNDQAGVIVFGRRARLELPPTDAPLLNFREVLSPVDATYTDIAAAIKLALASFPEGTGKRIVLLSDGNENLGNAEEQARLAKLNNVQIDVVPLGPGYRNTQEVLVERIEAPPVTEQGSRVPVRVLLRSYNTYPVVGELTVRRASDGASEVIPGMPLTVRVQPGLNAFTFKQPLEKTLQSYTYEAIFVPQHLEDARGKPFRGRLGEDRVQNNRATTHVVARGQRRVLLVEQNAGDHQLLVDRLKLVAHNKYQLISIPVDRLPQNKEELGVFLSNYDCVLLANLPAETLSDDQQEMIRSNTHEQGCGLIMVGGPDSFGAGGWQQTPIEKALPVDCDIHALKVQGKGGLVMIMHASEMAEGNFWQKQIAKLAINKLSPVDEVGVIQLDPMTGRVNWHIPMQAIGGRRERLLAQVDKMTPGDMPDFDPAIEMGYKKLIEPSRGLATKHMIIISDGDPMHMNRGLIRSMKADKVSCSTIGVATHGASEDAKLKSIADGTGGRFYKVTSAKALPAIYIKETRIVSQSFVHDKPFPPKMLPPSGPTEGLPRELPRLHGFVRTSLKPSPLVEPLIMGVPTADQQYPVLAIWHYGLGKSVAFTSDARTLPGEMRLGWDREWAGSDMYGKFWEQTIDWALRPVETGKLVMSTEYRDGRVRVTIDARDADGKPINDLSLQGGLTTPSNRPDDPARPELRFEQKSSGVYQAEVRADEAGSYFLNAVARRKVKVMENGKEVEREEVDSVRSGVTIPYSPEFADLEGNAALLEKLRDATGGQEYKDEPAALAEAARSGDVFRPGLPSLRNLQPIWYWLLFLTGVFLFFDVAVRRIALDTAEVSAGALRLWETLRHQPSTVTYAPQYLERLKSRKAEVTETLGQEKGARRFEAAETVGAAPVGAHEMSQAGPAVLSAPVKAPSLAPKKEEDADAMSRLLKAKKRALQDRDKDGR